MDEKSLFKPADELKEQEKALVQKALDASNNAYCPYSGLKIGAAILSGSKIYAGANVENSSFGLSICAEKSAIVSAISSGSRKIDLIAVASNDAKDLVPCGSCLQFMSEFCKDLTILIRPSSSIVYRAELSSLLPARFSIKKDK